MHKIEARLRKHRTAARVTLPRVATSCVIRFDLMIGGSNAMTAPDQSDIGWRDGLMIAVFVVVLTVAVGILSPHTAAARDTDGRFASSPLHNWFESLHSGKGPCCSDADGTALSDVDWETHEGHYRVRIEGQWWDVPDEAVITEPNRAGRTMVWPIYYRTVNTPLRIEIRCFMPGSMI
jgi:hypothetical protein